jgi:transposase
MTSKRDHAAMEKRRGKAVALFEKGHGPSAVARRLGVRRQSAHAWQVRWREQGKDGLKSQGAAGRKRRLTPQQEDDLAQAILDGPEAAGHATAVWTLPRLAALIRQRHKVDYHPGHVWHLLGRLGFSCQRPTRRALERNAAEVKRWHRQRYPQLKKKLGDKGAPLSSLTKAG